MKPQHGDGHRPGGLVPPPPIRKGFDAEGGMGPIDDEAWELD